LNINLNIQVADPAHVQIERALRRQIQSGELSPNQKLPSTDELVRQLGVGRDAVHRAMVALAKDGWIERKPMRGTFVRERTNAAYIGVMFSPSLTSETAHFQRTVYQSISREFAGLKDCAWQCRAYDGFRGLNTGQAIETIPSYRNLARDMKNYTFAGFIQILGSLAGKKLTVVTKGYPVAKFGPPQDPMTDVALDYEGFGRESVEYMIKKGMKKIVYFRVMEDKTGGGLDRQGIESAAARLRITKVEIHQMQYAKQETCLQESAYNDMLALMKKWDRTGKWPEGLIVSDDIAMYGVALALAHRGIEMPKRLTVVTMANKGVNLWYGIPVVRNEFAPDEAARELIHILSMRVHKKELPALPIKIPCKLSEEIR